ncbi:MAG: tetratricopeptide repeat protein [Quisquiliibacterium sp.]
MLAPSAREPLDAALALAARGRLGEARARLARLLRKHPGEPEIQLHLAGVLQAANRLDEAAALFAELASHRPDLPVASIGLARVSRDKGDIATAERVLRRALALNPGEPLLWAELAGLRHFEHEFETAIRLNLYLAVLTPGDSKAFANIAEALAELQREEEALSFMDRALALDPASAQLRLNRAFTLLALGRYREGWEAYEARLDSAIADAPQRNLTLTRWKGEALDRRHILVCSEQGVGDQFFFGAYLPKLTGLAEAVTVETDPRLVALFARSLPGAAIAAYSRRVIGQRPVFNYGWLSRDGGPDCYIDLASLPLLLKDDHKQPLTPGGFLIPDAARVEEWKDRLATIGGGRPVIGLFWRSGLITPARARFYPIIERWGPVLSIDDICFVSLQFDDDVRDIATAETLFGTRIHKLDGIDLRNDLDQVAALCRALDGVVAPSTTTANLASAVGTRTVIVDRTRSWPPMIGDHEAILSASERVFPPNQGDWDWVFREARRRVLAWLGRAGP